MSEIRTRVVLLGTGTPRTEADRAGTSTAVIVDDRPYIFDFGPGVGLRLSEGYRMGITGLAMSGVTRAFLTHMHSDHTLGLGSLMLTPWMFGREEPLEVYGPKGTAAMARAIAEAYTLDVAKRTLNEPHTDRGQTKASKNPRAVHPQGCRLPPQERCQRNGSADVPPIGILRRFSSHPPDRP